MSDTQPMQANGGGKQPGEGKDTEGQIASGGQSGGKAYPNDAPKGKFDGGQSAKDYHGGDRLGDESVEDAEKK